MESSPRKGTQRRGTEGARGWMTVRNRVVAVAKRGQKGWGKIQVRQGLGGGADDPRL